MTKNSPHSASHCCDCRRKSLSGNWKTSVGQSILEEVPVQDKYRLWIDQVNSGKKTGTFGNMYSADLCRFHTGGYELRLSFNNPQYEEMLRCLKCLEDWTSAHLRLWWPRMVRR